MTNTTSKNQPTTTSLRHALSLLEAESRTAWHRADYHEGRLLTITGINNPQRPAHERTLYDSETDTEPTRKLRHHYRQLRQYAMDITAAMHRLKSALEQTEHHI